MSLLREGHPPGGRGGRKGSEKDDEFCHAFQMRSRCWHCDLTVERNYQLKWRIAQLGSTQGIGFIFLAIVEESCSTLPGSLIPTTRRDAMQATYCARLWDVMLAQSETLRRAMPDSELDRGACEKCEACNVLDDLDFVS